MHMLVTELHEIFLLDRNSLDLTVSFYFVSLTPVKQKYEFYYFRGLSLKTK